MPLFKNQMQSRLCEGEKKFPFPRKENISKALDAIFACIVSNLSVSLFL